MAGRVRERCAPASARMSWPGDAAGEVRHQEDGEAAQLFCLGHPAQRVGRGDRRDPVIVERGPHRLGQGGTGRDGDHPDVRRPELDGHGLGEVIDARLGRSVRAEIGRRPGGLAGADVEDHAPASLGQHRPGFRPAAQGGQHQVLVDEVAPELSVHVDDPARATAGGHADVVDRDVETSQPVDRLIDHALDLAVVATVGRDGHRRAASRANGCGHLLGGSGSDVRHGYGRPRSSQPARDLGPDPGTRPGHEGRLPRQIDGYSHGFTSSTGAGRPRRWHGRGR